MKTCGGGTFGCWTSKKVNEFLKNVTGGDASVQNGFNGCRPSRDAYKTFREFSKASERAYGYVCIDTYRPGMHFWGKTPKEAAIKAGFTLLP